MSYKKRDEDRIYHRNRMYYRYHRWKETKACGTCGEPTTINPLTKKPYALCHKHRLMKADSSRRYYAKKRRISQVNGRVNRNSQTKE